MQALETFDAFGVAFVSPSEEVDTSTPMGKMVFTVLGAVAESEQSLIAEHVRTGLRNARSKGTRLGCPRVSLDASRVAQLRSQGRTIREIADVLGVSRGLIHKTLAHRGQIGVATTES
jgi:DNA invertase Pin-like site-specific DNA recombinase